MPSINWETKLGKQFPFGGSLPLFPACTHADCSRNYELEESSGEAGRAPTRRSRPAPDASPWGVGPWRHHDARRVGGRDKKGGRVPPPAAPCRSKRRSRKTRKGPKQNMTKHDRSDEKVCETSPCRQAPCRRLLVCCPENHLPSINWETKLGKQFAAAQGMPMSVSPQRTDPRPPTCASVGRGIASIVQKTLTGTCRRLSSDPRADSRIFGLRRRGGTLARAGARMLRAAGPP